MYKDSLEFTAGMVCRSNSLNNMLDDLNKQLCRRNRTLENEVPTTWKQREWWCILMQETEMECIVVEDLINNFDQVEEYLNDDSCFLK